MFRLGVGEVFVIVMLCVLALVFPSAVLVFLTNITKRIKQIEEKLKDKP
jgi:hypothetical protein